MLGSLMIILFLLVYWRYIIIVLILYGILLAIVRHLKE